MPKKTKVLTKTLYTYVRPLNDEWVRKTYKKQGFSSYSEFLDATITKMRSGQIKPPIGEKQQAA